MMIGPNLEVKWDHVSHIEEQEREALVRRAQAALAPSGVVTCGDCGCDIPPARRAALKTCEARRRLAVGGAP